MSRLGDWWTSIQKLGSRARSLGRRSPRTVQAWFDRVEQRSAGIDDYFAFQGVAYSGTPVELVGQGNEKMEGDFLGLIRDGLKSNSVIWACERLRVKVFCELRFMFQELNDGRPGELHDRVGTRLAELETPWANATTGDLLAKIRLHSDFGGNAYVVRSRNGTGLRVLRPDWITMILGTQEEGPHADPNDPDVEVLGYGYWPGGFMSGKEPAIYMADEVCHFAPMPDPAAHYRGMSWLNPVITEFQADSAATTHKMQFFRNGATLQTVVMVDKDLDETAFTRLMRKMNAETKGLANAYKTLFVTGGVDVKVVGADLRQLDFAITQGKGETRIAAAAGTPPVLVGLSEGLNAGQYNIYGQAKRSFVDGEIRPDWRNLCGSLQTLVTPPSGSRLWYDDRDIAYLREDQKDLADITHIQLSAVQIGITSGWDPDAAVKAVAAADILLLLGNHTGLFSVQLQPPSAGTMADPQAALAAIGAPAQPPALPAAPQTPPPNGKALPPNGKAVPPTNGKKTPAAIGAP